MGKPRERFEIYPEGGLQLEKQRYRWRLQANNSRVIADSGYSYASVAATRKAIYRVSAISDTAQIVVAD